MPHISIEQAIENISAGKMVILADGREPESEGDFCLAAEKATPQAINFMAKNGRGLICLSLSKEKTSTLDLPPMVDNNTSRYGTGFTVSIDARYGVSSGVSAADRATTILTAVAETTRPADLVRPGHVFPLMAREGGVIVRTGQTEGSVDLARLAGLKPAGVICGILDEDGSMAKTPALEKISEQHGIGICTIPDLIEYRMRTESFVHRAAEAVVPTVIAGEFKAIVYENDVDDLLHFAMVKGTIDPAKPVLVRVHSECLTGDIFGSMRCDCGPQLHRAMAIMEEEGSGVLLYIRQEGRGIGLVNKIRAYALQERGLDTVQANVELGFQPDMRNYGIGAQILADLGVRQMRLMTNNPKKMVGLQGYGLSVVEQVPIEIEANEFNKCYLECKKIKMGHMLSLEKTP
ncbi:MAG: bifunctional 3,4-dihydroxy-2-butanone-4-phosphate synthase/GTP cyclohydrolase II [Hyphomicrobiales bacterium]